MSLFMCDRRPAPQEEPPPDTVATARSCFKTRVAATLTERLKGQLPSCPLPWVRDETSSLQRSCKPWEVPNRLYASRTQSRGASRGAPPVTALFVAVILVSLCCIQPSAHCRYLNGESTYRGTPAPLNSRKIEFRRPGTSATQPFTGNATLWRGSKFVVTRESAQRSRTVCSRLGTYDRVHDMYVNQN